MSLPSALFEESTLLSVSASAGFIWVIVNGIRVFFQFYRKWLILAVSALVAIVAHIAADLPWTTVQILLVVGNAFLLAFTAAGAQEGLTRGIAPTQGEEQGKRRYRFFESWFD